MPKNYDEFYYDVMYWTWRSGGNPDRVDRDRVDESHDVGCDVDEAVAVELRHQRPQKRIEDGEY